MATPDTTAAEAQEGVEAAKAETTAQGRYIPYSGGSAGWFENSGVLKSERRNNYRYQEEMERPEVRRKLFERWGPSEERRQAGPRTRRQLPIHLLREGESTPMRTWDINNRGLRLQFTEPPRLSNGDEISVELLAGPEGEVLTLLDAQVIWIEELGTTRKLWNVGLFFPYISAESAVTLNALL
jgi:hypothetical protein